MLYVSISRVLFYSFTQVWYIFSQFGSIFEGLSKLLFNININCGSRFSHRPSCKASPKSFLQSYVELCFSSWFRFAGCLIHIKVQDRTLTSLISHFILESEHTSNFHSNYSDSFIWFDSKYSESNALISISILSLQAVL